MAKSDGKCSVADCQRPWFCGDFCKAHYSRWKRHDGDVNWTRPKKPIRYCSVPGCETIVYQCGLCTKHYMRKRRHNSEFVEIPPRAAAGEPLAFIKALLPSDDCILWPFGKDTGGYGLIVFEGKHDRAHCVSFKIHKGSIPDGLFVLHSCDVRHCINPLHLRAGTPLENTRDMISRGRKAICVGEQQGSSKLTTAEVREMHRLRMEENWSQEMLVDKFQISPNHIYAILRGNRWNHIWREIYGCEAGLPVEKTFAVNSQQNAVCGIGDNSLSESLPNDYRNQESRIDDGGEFRQEG